MQSLEKRDRTETFDFSFQYLPISTCIPLGSYPCFLVSLVSLVSLEIEPCPLPVTTLHRRAAYIEVAKKYVADIHRLDSAYISLIWLVGPAFLRDELAAVEASNKWRSAFHDDLWNAHDDSARFTRCALHFFWCIESWRKQLPLTFKLLQCAETSWTAWSSNKHRACQFLQNFKILHDSSTCNSLKLVVTRCNSLQLVATIVKF